MTDKAKMSVPEFSRRSGMDVETIRKQMRKKRFPLGFAIKGEGGSWVYHIPREPAEHYLRTGRLPE